jgi:hypothetical protein
METKSKTEELMKDIRQHPIYRQLVPMEAGVGWPIPLRKEGKVYVTLPFFGMTRTPEKGKTILSPPFAALTLSYPHQVVVEYVNLRFRNPLPELPWEGQVGTFPHPAVAQMKVSEYLEKRSELLAMYDEMLDKLAKGATFAPEWEARFKALLNLLMEPSLEPYYRALSPKFFDHFLKTDKETP